MKAIKGYLFNIFGDKEEVNMSIPEDKDPDEYFFAVCQNTTKTVEMGLNRGFLVRLTEADEETEI